MKISEQSDFHDLDDEPRPKPSKPVSKLVFIAMGLAALSAWIWLAA